MKSIIAITVSTVYLLLGYTLGFLDISIKVCAIMYLLSPIVIIFTVLVVLKDNTGRYPDLAKDEEWGYSDKNKNDLGVF